MRLDAPDQLVQTEGDQRLWGDLDPVHPPLGLSHPLQRRLHPARQLQIDQGELVAQLAWQWLIKGAHIDRDHGGEIDRIRAAVAQVSVDGSRNRRDDHVVDRGPGEQTYALDLFDRSRPGPDGTFVDTRLPLREQVRRVVPQQQRVDDLSCSPAELQHVRGQGRVGQLREQRDRVQATANCLYSRVPQCPGRARKATRRLRARPLFLALLEVHGG